MSGPEELLDPEVAGRVLARALAAGGDFAELFAERRSGMTMAIDESRIESVQSGAEQGAGVRVVSGGTTYFAHVDGLDPADLERAGGRGGGGAARRAGRAAGAAGGRHDAGTDRAPAGGGRRPSARRSCCASWTSAAARPAARSPS